MELLPETFVFEMTYACNHACPFCSCPWAAPGAAPGREMSIAQWKEAAEELIAQGVRNIRLSGGEPLLKEGLDEYLHFLAFKLRCAYGMQYNLQLASNATLLTDNMLNTLKQTGTIFCTSLPSLFDFQGQTGTELDFRAVLKPVCKASEMGISVVVGITLTKVILPELYEILSYALLSGANAVLLNEFHPSGRGAQHPEYLLNGDEIRMALSTAEEVFQTCNGSPVIGGEFSPDAVKAEDYPDLHLTLTCPAAKKILTLSPDGMIRICEHDPRTLCHWRDWRTLENNDRFQKMIRRDFPVCPLFPA